MKTNKTIDDQGIKQVDALKALKPEENQQNLKAIERIFPKETRSNEINNEFSEIKETEYAIVRKHSKYKTRIIFRMLKQ